MRKLFSLCCIIALLISGFSSIFGFEPESADCTPNNLEYIKFLYRENIGGLNDAVILYERQHPNYTMNSVVDYIYNPFLQAPADLAKCLRQFEVDPSAVIQVSPDLQKALQFDPERLNKTSSDFVKYVPIPEFSYPMPALSLSLTAILFLYRLRHKF